MGVTRWKKKNRKGCKNVQKKPVVALLARLEQYFEYFSSGEIGVSSLILDVIAWQAAHKVLAHGTLNPVYVVG